MNWPLTIALLVLLLLVGFGTGFFQYLFRSETSQTSKEGSTH